MNNSAEQEPPKSSLPPREWLATAAAQIYAAQVANPKGKPDSISAVEAALKIWRSSRIVLTELAGEPPEIDFWELAFEKEDAFERIAKSAYPDHEARSLEKIASRLYPKISKETQLKNVKELILKTATVNAFEAPDDDGAMTKFLFPTQARRLYHARQREISEFRKQASQKAKEARGKKAN
jgi:hypothetical protein